MTTAFTLYGDRISGNCLKVKWVAQKLGRPFRWVDVSVADGETRTEEFLKLNPFGQVPVAAFAEGRVLSQSNAIIFALAEEANSDLVPSGPFERAELLAWLFWEQYSHEPAIAVRRYRKGVLGLGDEEIDPVLLENGERALAHLDASLAGPFLLPIGLTIADVALVAYTRVADEGGFDIGRYPNLAAWVSRVERAFDIPDTEGRI